MVVALMFLAGQACPDEVYKWVDKDGTVHFSDSAPPDVKSEIQTLEEHEIGEPDEGELRRRQLLEQANIDAAKRVERQHAAAETNKFRAEARAEQERACLDARIRLEILQEPKRRVYRDADGNPRLHWKFDTYRGARTYVTDADRPAETDRARQEVAELCAAPDDPDAQAAARKSWMKSEKCDSAKTDLKLLQEPQSKSAPDDIEKQQRLIQLYCTEDF